MVPETKTVTSGAYYTTNLRKIQTYVRNNSNEKPLFPFWHMLLRNVLEIV